ncbi:MAG: homoserine O-acetyltransferase [Halobacteriales archaeon]|nr:homoserine O-acetyltransferase [Halobacteriales archaeon]
MSECGTVELGEFEFESGESVEMEVAYETYGDYDGDNAVLVCHALTGSAHVAGRDEDRGTSGQAAAWWDDVVGPGKAIDTNDYYVVCANVPGSCYGTTGPASENPETDEPYGPEFPPVTVTDWTRAQRRLLELLSVDVLHAVVGGSVGGMNVLEWAKLYPDYVEKLIPVATAARLDPQCLALDAVARRAILSDPNWNGGRYYDEDEKPDDGLALARQIGHIMYLSKDSMAQRFGRRAARREPSDDAVVTDDPTADFFPYRDVESYLDYQADKFVKRFDANSYLYLLRAMDSYDLSSGYESDADALAAFSGSALVVSFTGDWHFTVEQSESLAEAFDEAGADVRHRVVESDYGHDAFIVEPEKIGPPLRSFLGDGTR